MIRSLRTRVMLVVTGITAAVLIILGVGIYMVLQETLVRDFDRSLLVKAQAIASLTSLKGSVVKLDADDLQMPEFEPGGRAKAREYYEVWSNGKVVARSGGLKDADLVAAAPEMDKEPHYGELKLPEQLSGRMVAMSFSPALEDDNDEVHGRKVTAVVMVAKPTHEMAEILDEAATGVWILSAAAVVGACLAMWLVMRRAFRPLDAVAQQIAQLSPDALGTSIQAANAPSELEPVIGKLNNLLARLADAFARERAFSADVAHELRTPLAGMITTLEVCRSRPREGEAYQKAIDKSLLMANRMNQLVENLLLLARADSNQLKTILKDQRVDLLLEEIFAGFRGRFEERGVTVEWSVDSPLVLSTDAEQLGLVVRNLFDNALAYVNAGGTLWVGGKKEGDTVALTIANSGSHVPAHDVRHLTERFWRADAARTETGVHCGLGLAIVKRMTEILGMELRIESEVGKEFRVSVTGK